MSTSTDHTATGTTRALAPESTDVRFETTHLLGLGRVAGSVRLVGGSATLDPTGTELVAVEAEVDVTSFSTGSRARDRAVASARLLDTATHPRATYRSTAVERVGTGWLVHGTLTARGTKAPVDLHVTGTDLAGGGPVRATASVDRTPYGIAVPTAMAGRFLHVRVEVRTTRSATRSA